MAEKCGGERASHDGFGNHIPLFFRQSDYLHTLSII
jgi:hypothetical protein